MGLTIGLDRRTRRTKSLSWFSPSAGSMVEYMGLANVFVDELIFLFDISSG